MKHLAFPLFACLFALSLTSCKKDFHIERSTVIDAPAHAVYAKIVHFEEWKHWSPWLAADSTMEWTFTGQSGEIGSGYSWTSEHSGSGEMELLGARENEKIEYNTLFKTPYESSADGFVELKEVDEGTKVTWGFDTRAPFFMNMDKMVGADFEKGLGLLKAHVEANPMITQVPVYEEWPEKTFIVFTDSISIDSMEVFFATHFPALMNSLFEAGISPSGQPSAMYHVWNPENNTTKLSAAVPVESAANYESETYSVFTVPASKVVVYDYYGPYEGLGNAHDVIMNFMQEEGLSIDGLTIEEYVTDPDTVEDPSQILTRIAYYIVEDPS